MRREGFSIRIKLRMEIGRCKGASKWIPGRCSAVRVVSFEVVRISTEIHIFVEVTRAPMVKVISPGVVVGRSRANGRLRGKGMLTSASIPAMHVGRSLRAPYSALRDCLWLGGRRPIIPRVVVIINIT